MPQYTIYLHTYYMYVCLKHTQHQAASDGLLELAERWKIKITAPVSCRLLPFFVAFRTFSAALGQAARGNIRTKEKNQQQQV